MVQLANAKLHDLFATKEGYLRWRERTNLCFLVASTGLGKSTLIINDMAQKLSDQSFLYLVNRKRLEDEINNRVDIIELENVITETYQGLQKRADILEYLNSFDNIVCDEVHYFVSDSKFNDTVFYGFENILRSDTFKIFLTATPAAIYPILTDVPFDEISDGRTYFEKRKYKDLSVSEEEYDFYKVCSGKTIATSDFLKSFEIDKMRFYCLLQSMNNRIDNLYLYSKDEELELLLNDIPEDKKVLMFMGNIEDSRDGKKRGLVGWYEKLTTDGKTVSVAFSESATSNSIKSLRKLSKEAQMSLLIEKKFPTQYLISTTVLDNGIDIIDSAVKYIVCDIDEVNTISLEQCIGRKRLEDDETITLIVRDKKQSLSTKIREYDKIKAEYKKINENPKNYWLFNREYLDKCSRLEYVDNHLVVKPDILKMSYWEYERFCCDNFYIQTLCDGLRISPNKVFDITQKNEKREELQKNQELEAFLSENLDKILVDDAKDRAKEFLKKMTKYTQSKKVNEALEAKGLPYLLTEKRLTGGTRAWVIKERRDEWYCIKSAIRDIKEEALFADEAHIFEPEINSFREYKENKFYFCGEALLKRNNGIKSMYDWVGFATKNDNGYKYDRAQIVGTQSSGVIYDFLDELINE